MYRTVTLEPTNNEIIGNVILLTGRGGKAATLVRKFAPFLQYSRLIGVEPIEEWYPMPNGANDQIYAVEGLEIAAPQLKSFLENIQSNFACQSHDLALVGFSAGAVMALQMVTNYTTKYAAVVAHSGAILCPDKVQNCINDTPIFLFHNMDDDCFAWDERYIPMKNALINKSYKTLFSEKPTGGHVIDKGDVCRSSIFIANKFNYPEIPNCMEHEDSLG